MDLDFDEVDLVLLDLYDLAGEHGVCPFQFHRLLQDRITETYMIASEIEDAQADDANPPTIH